MHTSKSYNLTRKYEADMRKVTIKKERKRKMEVKTEFNELSNRQNKMSCLRITRKRILRVILKTCATIAEIKKKN